MAKDQKPTETRQRLLQTAFWEFYEHSFQGTGLGAIVKRAGVSKGALYNHFTNKLELGYAVVDEIIRPGVKRFWLKPFREIENPIEATLALFEGVASNPPLDMLTYGCPVNNLIQEMAPLDPGFRSRLGQVIASWQEGMASAFRDGQSRRFVRPDRDPDDIAAFILAAFEGGIGLAKTNQDKSLFLRTAGQLTTYLETLRP